MAHLIHHTDPQAVLMTIAAFTTLASISALSLGAVFMLIAEPLLSTWGR